MKPSFKPTEANVYRPSGNTPPNVTGAVPHSINCPHCGHLGSFAGIPNVNDITYSKLGLFTATETQPPRKTENQYRFGMRVCPNVACRGYVSVVTSQLDDWDILAVSPPQLINFRSENIPEKLVASMKEALASHSVQSYRASALMVRRTLEILCKEKGAEGKDLKERLSKLSQFAILPPKLLEAADHLRLLGNDAAHVEAKTYDDIDEPHAALAIEVAREILKAVYQHDDLISRLTRLKKP